MASERDLRLDFFRGLALFFIFVDHIPNNALAYFTLQAVGFCDAAEIFIFISGYTAALVYGNALLRDGPLFATAQVWRRVWQLYVAHVFLFVIFTALVSYSLVSLENSIYSEETRVADFLAEPHVAILNALILRFQPTFLDILPLYIVLLAVFPLVLLALRLAPWAALIPSFALWVIVQRYGLSLRGYPPGQHWFFNPLAWQFLFVLGAWLGYTRAAGQSHPLPPKRLPAIVASVVLGACVMTTLSWAVHGVWEDFPALFLKELWPVNKTSLAPIRLVNFIALAVVVTHFVRPETRFLKAAWARYVVVCGQQSLQIFCLGILLAVVAHFILSEVTRAVWMQIAVTAGGILVMIAMALLLDWYKRHDRGRPARAKEPVGAAEAAR